MRTRFFLIAAIAAVGVSSCEKKDGLVDEAYDYSDRSNWMCMESNPTKNVDLFYIYPTIVLTGNTPAAELTDSDKEVALQTFYCQAHCMGEYTNEFVPYYRQLTFDYAVKAGTSEKMLDMLRENIGKKDIFAALDYYFKNLNGGRPFILAAHSQGSALTRLIFEEYMPKHPEYFERMVAAYPLGFTFPKKWMAELGLKGATKEDDYGVVVAWNLEGAGALKPSMLVSSDDYVINPLTWSTDTTRADVSLNLGSFVWDNEDSLKFHIEKPGIADAKVDESRASLTCTTLTGYVKLNGDPFGDKSLHLKDWQAFYENLKVNCKSRIDAYFAAKK